MTTAALVLPSFDNPPVVEVAMSFGFAPIPGLQFGAMADLRNQWMDEYPLVEEQPFLDPPPQPQQTIHIEMGPPPRRLWLLGSQGDRVIQIQRDRLIANWRAVAGGDTLYPRYEPLRTQFLARWAEFQQFVAEKFESLSPALQFAEVTYVNLVPPADTAAPAIEDVLKIMSPPEFGLVGLGMVAYTSNWQTSDWRDRLAVVANVDPTAPEAPVVIQITAGAQIDDTRTAEDALDRAHDLVVGTFGVVTTDQMQQRWRRQL
jgi:uncharacterized protein (TIGR04255 family)